MKRSCRQASTGCLSAFYLETPRQPEGDTARRQSVSTNRSTEQFVVALLSVEFGLCKSAVVDALRDWNWEGELQPFYSQNELDGIRRFIQAHLDAVAAEMARIAQLQAGHDRKARSCREALGSARRGRAQRHSRAQAIRLGAPVGRRARPLTAEDSHRELRYALGDQM
jgi:hypothetical protein